MPVLLASIKIIVNTYCNVEGGARRRGSSPSPAVRARRGTSQLAWVGPFSSVSGGARDRRATDITATWALLAVGQTVLRVLSEKKPVARAVTDEWARKHVASPRRGRASSPSSSAGGGRAFRPPTSGPVPGRRRRRILHPAPWRRAGMPRAPPVLPPLLLCGGGDDDGGGGGGAARAEAAGDDAAALRLPHRQRPRATRAPLSVYLFHFRANLALVWVWGSVTLGSD